MTWTYSGDPSASDKDEVRFLIGDTDTTNQQVTDEEIYYALAEESTPRMAAYRIARALMGKYATKVDKSVGDLRLSYSQLFNHWKELADNLLNDENNPLIGDSLSPVPYAGGITISDKDTVEANTDRVEPAFKRGIHDNPSQSEPDDYAYD